MNLLIPCLAIVCGALGVIVGQGTLSLLLVCLCVFLALVTVARYVNGLRGHDPWAALRRERRRRRARSRARR